MNKIISYLVVFLFGSCYAQQIPSKLVLIPDIPGYKTLKCDFHMHTVFSDGDVWPTIRVEEAWQEGLDAIAITDHIEYQPHGKDVNTDLNRSYDLAKAAAEGCGLILIRSLEITRPMPPGHLNALFLEEPDSLKKEEYMDALHSAKALGAFVFWNHPGWTSQAPDGIKWYDIHTDLLNKGLFQGIEVVNQYSFYPEALDWCLEKNLTIMGNSDIHGTLGTFLMSGNITHRPVTLVFAKERSSEGIRDALINRRTAVWYEDKIIGSVIYLDALFKNSVKITRISRNEKTSVLKLTNHTDIQISFKITGSEREYLLLPRSSIILRANPEISSLEMIVNSFVTGKDKYLTSKIIIQ